LHTALISPSPELPASLQRRIAEILETLGKLDRLVVRDPAAAKSLEGELQKIRREVQDIGRLLSHAATFYSGWASVLGAASSTYTPAGANVESPAPPQVLVEG
jgi:hypothetical protein